MIRNSWIATYEILFMALKAPRGGAYVHFVQHGDTLSGIVGRHFRLDQHMTMARKVAEVARRSRIKDPDRIYQGQAIILAEDLPEEFWDSVAERAAQEDLAELSRRFAALGPEEKEVLGRHSDVLDTIASYGSDAAHALSRFANDHDLGVLNDLFGGKVEGAVPRARACFENPAGEATRLAGLLQPQVRRLMETLRRSRLQAVDSMRNSSLRQPPSFTVRISPTLAGVRALNRQMDLMAGIVRVGKWAGRGSAGVNIVLATANITAAPEGSKAKAIGKEVGSIVVGGLGAVVAGYAVCSLVLGLPTVGTSPVWCGLLVGGAAGAYGANRGGAAGERIGGSLGGPAASLWNTLSAQFEGAHVQHNLGILEISGM